MTAQTAAAGSCPFAFGRRGFVRAAVGAGAALTVGAATPAVAVAATAEHPGPRRTVPFHGARQAGITTPAAGFAAFAAFDVRAKGRAGLETLLRTVTDRARFLTAGGTPPADGPADNGVVGPSVPADNLTLTVGVGAALFDDRYGLGAAKPVRLGPMPAFRGDRLRPAETGGDLSLQICADSRDTVLHALLDVVRAANGALRPRWRVDGFRNEARPDGAQRNLMGFKDGIVNPDTADERRMDRVVWVTDGGGEPAWAVGGTYQVLRTIRMRVEAWENLPVETQERIVGRRRDTGAPLDGLLETDLPDYTKDPDGLVTPGRAHIRLANPRTADTDDSLLLRRAYNYDRGVDRDGTLDMGLLFCCYNQDLARQFEAMQRRLVGEPLADYLTVTGGGYFYVLPGIADAADWYGRSLLAAGGTGD
ncbi:Dyp-type peroxidase [Kitasatospora cinereorecta]|uniref:Dyp-type peroxidase n=1 Tax=Kitasatospora cinereorecta TaxID=285560 RepID=A0ABW0V504_9ACTN